MLTRLKLKRGEGKLVEARCSQSEPQQRREILPHFPPPSSPPKEAEEAISMHLGEEETHEEVDPKEEERVFRKAFLDITEMVRVLYQDRNERIEGEGSKLHKEGQGSSGGHNDEDKSKKGNGGNGGSGNSSSSPS